MSLTPERTAELQELCRQYRIDVLTAIHGAQSGHPGGSLSVCEILTLLYQQRMHVDAAHPDDPDRDRLVLCKGHAAPMLYRNLIGKGFLPPESMNTLRQTGSPLQGHPCMRTPGVDMPSGPLGIGLAAAQGMALGLKLNHSDARVYAVLGDGELDEGAVWEAAASAVKFGLDNLTAIVDWNKVQLDRRDHAAARPARQVEGLRLERAALRRARSDGARRCARRGRRLQGRADCDPRRYDQGQGRVLHGGQVRLARQGHSGRGIRAGNAGTGR